MRTRGELQGSHTSVMIILPLLSKIVLGSALHVKASVPPMRNSATNILSRQPMPCGTSRRAAISLGALSLTALSQPAKSDDGLNMFDYMSPVRLAVKKQQQKQEDCYNAGECVDDKPYYAIECQRDDVDCLQRKRRLASQEFKNFSINPTSSPILLLAAGDCS